LLGAASQRLQAELRDALSAGRLLSSPSSVNAGTDRACACEWSRPHIAYVTIVAAFFAVIKKLSSAGTCQGKITLQVDSLMHRIALTDNEIIQDGFIRRHSMVLEGGVFVGG
jgi:hypothetical protein